MSKPSDDDLTIADIEAILGPALPVELTGLTEAGRRAIAARMDEMKVNAENAVHERLRAQRP